jgi:hypothetical protein
MKKVRKQEVYCSRCGDEISPEELALLQGDICAFCYDMHLEAAQIQTHKIKIYKLEQVLNSSCEIKSQLPHRQS